MTITNSTTVALHNVFSVAATNAANVYSLDVDLTDMNGERYRCNYISAPDDTFGLAPTIRQWLADNEGSYEIASYAPPTAEDIRASMPSITPRQFWIAAASIDVTKDDVLSAVADITDVAERNRMLIEVTEASVYERANPYIDDLAGIMGVSAVELDALWMWASDL